MRTEPSPPLLALALIALFATSAGPALATDALPPPPRSSVPT